jgi:Zn-dependent peptidase ImmA (M78 family)
MSRSSPEVTISTEVMMWLCGSSGYSAAEISKKTGIRERIVQSWCEGTGKPVLALSKVEMLATLFRRPLAVFLLSRPLDEPHLPKDFRRHPDSASALSNELLLAIRKARRIQQIHHELTDNLNRTSQVRLKTRTINDDPEQVAREERQRSGINISGDTEAMTPVRAFDQWREWLESLNISVLKLKIPANDARGFSLTDGEPYVVVVNSADAERARIFTLFHEYAHLLLDIPVICNQGENDLDDYKEIERWCNHFAGAFLAPKDEIERNPAIQSTVTSGNFMRAAASIQKHFLISKEAGLMRLLTLDLITSSQFRRGRDQLREEFIAREAKKKEREEADEEDEGGFGTSLDRKCVAEKGAGYVSLVIENVRQGRITSSDAIDYLDVRLRHLEKFQESMGA